MKKTLIISLEYPPVIGGIATYVHDLAAALDPAKTVVLAPKEKGQKEWDAAVSYTVIRKSLLFPKWIWPRWIKLVFIVRRIVKKEGIETILVQHVLPAGYAAIVAKRLWKVPFLLFSHGTDLVAGTATPWKKKMVTKVSEVAEQIIFNSNSLQRRFLRVLPQFENKSRVLYPCPEPDFLVAPPQETIDTIKSKYALAGKKVLLSVSRITDGKGFPHLIRMMPKILEQEPNLVWFICGDGDKRPYVMKLIQEHNLHNVVRYIGEIPHADLKAYYYTADLFVLLTHPDEGKEEGLGLVFLEAAAAGVPVVAGKSGGVEEAVIHEQTGMVVDVFKGDPQVVETIVALLKDKEAAQRLGRSAKERIQKEFVWGRQLSAIEPWLAGTHDVHEGINFIQSAASEKK